jgi:hypothetical protein
VLFGRDDSRLDSAVRRRVRFVGGPWDGDAARYYGLDGTADVVAGDGRYRFAGSDADGGVVYVFHHGGRAPGCG